MRLSEWEPVYADILDDMGLDRASDEASARLLRMLTMNSDLISEDDLLPLIGKETVVIGGNVSPNDIEKIRRVKAGRTLISAGSATDVLVPNGVIPDIVVTDLDGDAEMQKKASASGAVTLVHAHGDNTDLIMKHAKDLAGRIMVTTQSGPDHVLYNFGGFTDGDRAVCTARHFGSDIIILIGFDLDRPASKAGTDIELKRKKLRWAKKIIYDMNPPGVTITSL